MAGTRTFIACSRQAAFRAEERPTGEWQIDPMLTGEDVRCLAADPRDGSTFFAGTQGNGVFRSSDGGRTWNSAGMAGSVVKSLAVSPHEHGVVYAGTRPAFVYRTGDGGQSWMELNGFRKIRGRWMWFSPAESPWKAYVNALAISPTDPDLILAGIEFGAVVLSRDGGRTWSAHRKGALRDCHDLAFHISDGDWVYEAGGTGGGASVSRDGGKTWKQVRQGLAVNYGVACAADPERPEIWYVSVAPGPNNAYSHPSVAYLYRASGGAPWKPIGWAPHPMQEMPLVLATDPGSPGQLYAGTTAGEVWQTADYGDNWTRLPLRFGGPVHSLVLTSPSRRR
jgi:hypothetical protein